MRAVVYYILIVIGLACVAMFFISQRSQHLQIGYELTQYRRQRDTLREDSRKLEYEVFQKARHESLAQNARRLGLSLQPPVSGVTPR